MHSSSQKNALDATVQWGVAERTLHAEVWEPLVLATAQQGPRPCALRGLFLAKCSLPAWEIYA